MNDSLAVRCGMPFPPEFSLISGNQLRKLASHGGTRSYFIHSQLQGEGGLNIDVVTSGAVPFSPSEGGKPHHSRVTTLPETSTLWTCEK